MEEQKNKKIQLLVNGLGGKKKREIGIN